jgi:NitT/TauT family transport system substrate-binding protein
LRVPLPTQPRAITLSRRDWLQHWGAAVVCTGATGLLVNRAWAQAAASSSVAGTATATAPTTATSTLATTTATTAAATAPAGSGTYAIVANNKLEKKQITIAVANKGALAYLPLTVAEQLGFFRLEGLEVDIVEPPYLARAQQLATSGGADMVSGWVEQTLVQTPARQQAKGPAFVAFVLMGRAPQMAFGVSTKTLPDFKNMSDLRGKKIGIIAPNTPSHTIAHLVLSRAGLRLTDMNFVSVGAPSGALAALRAGQIDALSYVDPLATQLEQRGELRVVADTRTLRGTLAACGGDMPASCLYATPEFIQNNPVTTQAVTHAMVRALKWLQTAGVSDMMKIVPESYFAGDRALYLAAFARMREAIALDGIISPAGMRNTLEAIRGAEPTLRTQGIDLDKCYTNVFAQIAKQRFKV